MAESKFFTHDRKYAINDYNRKEERWEGCFLFIFKLGNDEKVKCSNVIMCGLTAK